MRNFFHIVVVFFVVILFAACNSNFTPKEKGYPTVTFPAKKYQLFNQTPYPYSFEYPVYATVNNKVDYFGKDMKNDGWLNIFFPNYNATLYISYNHIPASKPHLIDTLMRDAYQFVNNHNNMASFIDDSAFTTDHDIKGVFFHIGGNVATTYQFFLTDSTTHFVRAALYYETVPNADSLAPINSFLLKDLEHMVHSFRWK